MRKHTYLILFYALLIFTTASHSAENLVLGYQPPIPPSPDSGVVTSYPANLDTDILLTNGGPSGIGIDYSPLVDFIDITLPDSGITLTFERSYDDLNYVNNNYIHWSGNQFGSSENYISILVDRKTEKLTNDKAFGVISYNGTAYNLMINNQGNQVVNLMATTPLNCGLEDEYSALYPSHPGNTDSPAKNNGEPSNPQNTLGSINGTTIIDVGTLYTSRVRSFFNSDEDVVTQSISSINIANMFLARSGIDNIRFEQAATQAIEPSLGTACEQRTSACNLAIVGSNFSISQFRENSNADLVTIVQQLNVEFLTGDVMGIAHLPGSSDFVNPFACRDAAFDDRCYINKIRLDSYTLFNYAHELGHNLGLFHDIGDSNDPNSFPAIAGARGFLNSNGNFATTMVATNSCEDSGNTCNRINRFSNPDPAFNFNGLPTGITGQADSFNGIQQAAGNVASYRVPPEEDSFEDDDIAAAASVITVTGNHTQNHNFIEDESNTQTFRPDWVKLLVPNPGLMTISASDKGPDAFPCFQLFQTNGNTQGAALTNQACSTPSIPNQSLQFNSPLDNAEYFLLVTNSNSVHTNSNYTLNISFDPTPPPPSGDAFEEDDTALQASVINFTNNNTDSGWIAHNFDDDSNDWIEISGIQSIDAATSTASTSQVYVIEFYLDSTGATSNPPQFCITDTQVTRTDSSVQSIQFVSQCDDGNDEEDPFPPGQVAVGAVVRYPGTQPSTFESLRVQVRFRNNQQFTVDGTDYMIRAIGRSCDTPCNYVWPSN